MGGLEGPVCTGKTQGKQGGCRAIPLESRHTLILQEMVLLQPWKHPGSFAPSHPSPIQASCWNWGRFPSLSQVLWYLPVQGSAGKRSQLMAGMWWMNPVCLHPQPTPPLYLSGVLALLHGHSSLCAFPDFWDICSLLMPVFRSMVLMGTVTVHLLSRWVQTRRVGRSCWDALQWMNTWETLLSEPFPIPWAELQGCWGENITFLP